MQTYFYDNKLNNLIFIFPYTFFSIQIFVELGKKTDN